MAGEEQHPGAYRCLSNGRKGHLERGRGSGEHGYEPGHGAAHQSNATESQRMNDQSGGPGELVVQIKGRSWKMGIGRRLTQIDYLRHFSRSCR